MLQDAKANLTTPPMTENDWERDMYGGGDGLVLF